MSKVNKSGMIHHRLCPYAASLFCPANTGGEWIYIHFRCICNCQINGQSMANKSHDDALVLLRSCPPSSTVQLIISRQALKQTAPDNVVVVRVHSHC